jgi:hypothetical protein
MNPAVPLFKEQRRETRRAAQGAVMVRCDAPSSLVIHGRLVDLSTSGFRMSHEYRGLEPGQTVDYSHCESAGKARVVWNRITVLRVETGFHVLA